MKKISAFLFCICVLVFSLSPFACGALYFFSAIERYSPEGCALALRGSFDYPELKTCGDDCWFYFNMAFIPEKSDCRFTLFLDEDCKSALFIGTDSLGTESGGISDEVSYRFGTGLDNFRNVVIRLTVSGNKRDTAIFIDEEMIYIGAVKDDPKPIKSFAGTVTGTAVIDDYHIYRNDSMFTEYPVQFDELVQKTPFLPGDTDGDGILTSSDLILLRRCLAGHAYELSLSADMNCDGKISAKDLLLLRRFLSE